MAVARLATKYLFPCGLTVYQKRQPAVTPALRNQQQCDILITVLLKMPLTYYDGVPEGEALNGFKTLKHQRINSRVFTIAQAENHDEADDTRRTSPPIKENKSMI
jgi:hypothetical protein